MSGGAKDRKGSIRREVRAVADERLARVVARGRTVLGGGDDEDVHQLRVATRRAVAALDAFEPWLRRKRRERLRKRLRGLRRSTGAARDAAVRIELLREMAVGADGQRRRVLEALIGIAEEERRCGLAGVAPAIRAAELESLGSGWRGLVRRRGAKGSFKRAGCEALGARAEALRAIEVSDAESLHRLRIEIKRARYTLELFGRCGSKARVERLLARLGTLQDRLGEVNDTECLAAWIESRLGILRASGHAGASASAGARDGAPGRHVESGRGEGRASVVVPRRVGR